MLYKHLCVAIVLFIIGFNVGSAQDSCSIDVKCAGAQRLREARSVVYIEQPDNQHAGQYIPLGTGVLINDFRQDQTPYILTAAHLLSDAGGNAPSTWCYLFNYNASSCGGTSITRQDSIVGARLWYASGGNDSDIMLLQLNSSIPSSWHVLYSGWDASSDYRIHDSLFVIHHPRGKPTKVAIALTADAGDTTYLGSPSGPLGGNLTGAFWEVPGYSIGATDTGSSGSPLFDQMGRVIGVLSIGSSQCQYEGFAGYGDDFASLDEAYPKIAPWIDPDQLSGRLLNSLDPDSAVSITIDQVAGSGGSADSVARWETINVYKRLYGFIYGYTPVTEFVNLPVPLQTAFELGTTEVLRATSKIISSQKYNNWNNFSDVTNHHTFLVNPQTLSYKANLSTIAPDIVVRNVLVDAPGSIGDSVALQDPWFPDSSTTPYGDFVNRGMNAPFIMRASPFSVDTTTAYQGISYKGVLIQAGGKTIAQLAPPYYSVQAKPNPSIGAYSGAFIGWASNNGSTIFAQPSSLATPVIFFGTDTLTAQYKGHLISSLPSAISGGGQHRLITYNFSQLLGHGLYLVYQSGNAIFETNSADNGATWGSELPGLPLPPSGTTYRDPCIQYGLDSLDYPTFWEAVSNDQTNYYHSIRSTESEFQTIATYTTPLTAGDIRATVSTSDLSVSGEKYIDGVYQGGSGLATFELLGNSTETQGSIPNTTLHSQNPAIASRVKNYLASFDQVCVVWEEHGTIPQLLFTESYFSGGGTAWYSPYALATSGAYESNINPSMTTDASGNVCVAWEYRNSSTNTNMVKFLKIDTTGYAVSSSETQFTAPYATNIFLSPSLSSHKNSSDTSSGNDLTLVWSSSQGTMSAQYSGASGLWAAPVRVDADGQGASVQMDMADGSNARNVALVSALGPPYAIKVDHISQAMSVTSTVSNGWNLGSVPVVPLNSAVAAIFPNASPTAYGYAAGYDTTSFLTAGKGYWLNFSFTGSVDTVQFYGDSVSSISVNVGNLWNIVGTTSSPLSTTEVRAEDGAQFSGSSGLNDSSAGTFFGYSPAAGYSTVSQLSPGSGYWLKMEQGGQICYNCGSPLAGANSAGAPTDTQKLPCSPTNGALPLRYPINGSVGMHVTDTLVWVGRDCATGYRAQLSLDPNFGSFVATDTVANVPPYQVIVAALTPGTEYYWRVRGDSSGHASPWSATWNFVTQNLPFTPVLGVPSNGATSQPIAVSVGWNITSGASKYWLQVSTSATFTSGMIVSDSTPTGTSYQLPWLNFNTTYYWRVLGINWFGDGAWSSTSSFTTGAAPAAPTLASPSNGATGQSITPTVTWNAVSGASYYYCEISTDPNPANYTFLDSTIYTHTGVGTLNGLTTYYWRVCAVNSIGAGPWSNVWNFATVNTQPPATPALSIPANHATNIATPTLLVWNSAQYATSYKVEVSTSSTFSTLEETDSVTTASARTNSLRLYTKYYWKVQAINNVGTAWSTAWYFTTGQGDTDMVKGPPVTTLTTLDEVTVQDGKNFGQTLYLMDGRRKLGDRLSRGNSMPPETPPGIFGARFQSGKYIESIPSSGKSAPFQILVKSAHYPLKFSWNLKPDNAVHYRLNITGRAKDTMSLSGKGSVTLASPVSGGVFLTANTVEPNDVPTSSTEARAINPALLAVNRVKSFGLSQNFPNPFNPATTIRYELPATSVVEVTVWNVLGQKVATLANGIETGGIKYVTWDAGNFGSGLYFLRMRATQANDASKHYENVRRMLLVK